MKEYTRAPKEVAMIERALQDNAIKHALKMEATKQSHLQKLQPGGNRYHSLPQFGMPSP